MFRGAVMAAFALGALLPGTASAQSAIVAQSMFGTTAPYAQDVDAYGPASLRIVWDTTYNPSALPSPQTMSDANIHFDNDFAFDTTGLTQCPATSLAGTTTAAAIAACPGAHLGSGGSATLINASMSYAGVVTTFNGPPSGSDPVIFLHLRFGAPINLTTVIAGTLGPSTRGGDYGSQIYFVIPDYAPTSLVLTHMDARFDSLEPAPGHFFYSARCHDSDHLWNYAGDFAFRSGGGYWPATQVQQCTNPMRARFPLLHKKKCKKRPAKKGAGAAKRCKKKKNKKG
jgi:hypothetical protein